MKKKKVYLTLQNGRVFEGYRFGGSGNAVGELVFNTGMVGYLKTLTDPAYFGQIVVQTFPMIGNYGVIESEFESDKTHLSAYIVREYCEKPSNFRMEGDLNSFLEKSGVVGVCGVDTRELTKILREEGTMNAAITDKPLSVEELARLQGYTVESAVESVGFTEKKIYKAECGSYTVALWDFGGKNSTVADLTARGFNVIRMPAFATAEEILALGADGVMLGDGAGDPTKNPAIVEEIKKLLGKLPVFAFGLGHQLVALALGGKVQKMKHGHRGGNQPVKYLESNRVYISSQNHGYVVENESIQEGTVNFVNVNDGTCEGIDYPAKNAFSVQFAPASCSAAGEQNILYDKFISLIEKEKKNA